MSVAIAGSLRAGRRHGRRTGAHGHREGARAAQRRRSSCSCARCSQFTQASGSMFGIEVQGVAAQAVGLRASTSSRTRGCWSRRSPRSAATRRRRSASSAWDPDPATTLDHLIETEDEVTEALHAVIGRALERSSTCLRKQHIDWLRRARRASARLARAADQCRPSGSGSCSASSRSSRPARWASESAWVQRDGTQIHFLFADEPVVAARGPRRGRGRGLGRRVRAPARRRLRARGAPAPLGRRAGVRPHAGPATWSRSWQQPPVR